MTYTPTLADPYGCSAFPDKPCVCDRPGVSECERLQPNFNKANSDRLTADHEKMIDDIRANGITLFRFAMILQWAIFAMLGLFVVGAGWLLISGFQQGSALRVAAGAFVAGLIARPVFALLRGEAI